MIDNYNRKINYLRVSVTDKCNLRCRYCMPEEGVQKRNHEEMMTVEETYMAIKSAAELGVEPSVYPTVTPVVLPGMERMYIRAIVGKREEKG